MQSRIREVSVWMKSVNPELSQRLDEITTDKLNTSTSYPDIVQSKEEETHLSKDDDQRGNKDKII